MAVEAELVVLTETIRLKALGNSLVALSHLADAKSTPLDDNQVEEIGLMVVELAEKIEKKLSTF